MMTHRRQRVRVAAPLNRLLFLSVGGWLAVLLSVPAYAASCTINNTPLSPAEQALFRGDLTQSATLVAAAKKYAPDDERVHATSIRLLIEEGKLEEARHQIDEWTSRQPTSPWLMVAAGEERYASGSWLEGYALMNKALRSDPCMAEAYNGAAHFEMMAGYRATARRHLNLAHQLEPANDLIQLEWIRSLDPEARAAQMELFSREVSGLSDKQRATLQHSLAVYRASAQNSCQLVAAEGPLRMPMQPIYDPRATTGIQSWGLEVAINGHKRVLEIDTGASGVLLSHSAAGGLQLKPIASGAVSGFGGQGPSGTTISHADSVQIGGLRFKDCAVEELNNFGLGGGSQIQNRLDNLTGMVGTDIFARYMVTLDYIRHELRLDPLPTLPGAPVTDSDPLAGSRNPDWLNIDRATPASMSAWTKLYARGHEIIVPVELDAKVPALFLVDTGNFTNIVDRNLAKRVTTAQRDTTLGIGVSGFTEMSSVGRFTLDFAGLRLPVQNMESIDLSRFGGVNGFLGLPTLGQLVLHLDYRDNLGLFEAPNGKKINVN